MRIIAGRALVSDSGARCSIGACGLDPQGRVHVLTAGHTKGREWRIHEGFLGHTATRLYRPTDILSILVKYAEPTNLVHSDQEVRIIGFEDPRVGLSVARIGAKSLWGYGTITHTLQDVCYDLGRPIQGLARTSITSARGDSGGPVITIPVDGKARLVGFVSGGGEIRVKGPVTMIQPARQAFEALDLAPWWG